jgi:hypothetical protein
MNPILFFSMLIGALYISSSSITEICPAIHKGSQITTLSSSQFRYSKVVMHEHVIGYCDVEQKIYGNDMSMNMVQEWIKSNPNKPVYHTYWGTLTFDSLIGMYVLHAMFVVFVVLIWSAIQDEEKRR